MALTLVHGYDQWKYINTGSTAQNVRSGAGTGYSKLTTLPISLVGTQYNVRNVQTASNGIDWVEIEYSSGSWGWCAVESQDVTTGKWYYYWEYVSAGSDYYTGTAYAYYYWPDAGTTTYKLQKTASRTTTSFTLRSSPGNLAIDGTKSDIILTINYNNGNANGSQTGKKWTQTSYTFNGWDRKTSATAPNSVTAGTKDHDGGATYSSTEDLYFYADYTTGTSSTKYSDNTKDLGTPTKSSPPTTYTVTYNANGGTVSTTSAQATKTTTYRFSGWTRSNTNITISGTSCTFIGSGTVTANYTSSTSTTSVTLPTPTRAGYKFLGWSTNSAATTGTYQGGASYTPETNITLYAIWGLNGLVRVYNGTEWKLAIPYVYNGSTWQQTIPLIYDGSTWRQGG